MSSPQRHEDHEGEPLIEMSVEQLKIIRKLEHDRKRALDLAGELLDQLDGISANVSGEHGSMQHSFNRKVYLNKGEEYED